MRLLKYIAQFAVTMTLSVFLLVGVILYGFVMIYGILGAPGSTTNMLAEAPYFTTITYSLTGVWIVSCIGLTGELHAGHEGSLLFKILLGSLGVSTLLGVLITYYYVGFIFFDY